MQIMCNSLILEICMSFVIMLTVDATKVGSFRNNEDGTSDENHTNCRQSGLQVACSEITRGRTAGRAAAESHPRLPCRPAHSRRRRGTVPRPHGRHTAAVARRARDSAALHPAPHSRLSSARMPLSPPPASGAFATGRRGAPAAKQFRRRVSSARARRLEPHERTACATARPLGRWHASP